MARFLPRSDSQPSIIDRCSDRRFLPNGCITKQILSQTSNDDAFQLATVFVAPISGIAELVSEMPGRLVEPKAVAEKYHLTAAVFDRYVVFLFRVRGEPIMN
jgi:hypothetical protein